MAIQCQYDLEAHLDHIITFLLHPRKFASYFNLLKLPFLTSSSSETEKLAR